jgi:uncharacterized protein YndB with AHSA1/START domain
MLAKPSVTLKRHINGKPEQVFAAWTDPQKIVRWFGPQQTLLDTVKAELDVRVGGKFWVRFNTGDGDFHKVGGTYREVFPHTRLQFSWAWHSTPERESLVTVTIREDGDGSMLTLLHEQFFDQAAADGHKRGWTGTLEKLAAEFE